MSENTQNATGASSLSVSKQTTNLLEILPDLQAGVFISRIGPRGRLTLLPEAAEQGGLPPESIA